jgi:hypothetical protein
VTAREVNDAEAAIAEAEFTVQVKAFVVRPAVRHRIGGALERDRVSRLARCEIENSADTAHWNCPRTIQRR